MPDTFIPLVQLPDDAGTAADRSDIPRYNEELRQAHAETVRAAARHTRREPATFFDHPEQLAARFINDLEDDLDDEFPRAVHGYAGTVIFLLDILVRRDQDTRQ
jgi:hypothetical protein